MARAKKSRPSGEPRISPACRNRTREPGRQSSHTRSCCHVEHQMIVREHYVTHLSRNFSILQVSMIVFQRIVKASLWYLAHGIEKGLQFVVLGIRNSEDGRSVLVERMGNRNRCFGVVSPNAVHAIGDRVNVAGGSKRQRINRCPRGCRCCHGAMLGHHRSERSAGNHHLGSVVSSYNQCANGTILHPDYVWLWKLVNGHRRRGLVFCPNVSSARLIGLCVICIFSAFTDANTCRLMLFRKKLHICGSCLVKCMKMHIKYSCINIFLIYTPTLFTALTEYSGVLRNPE
jgi:hypothetical protein